MHYNIQSRLLDLFNKGCLPVMFVSQWKSVFLVGYFKLIRMKSYSCIWIKVRSSCRKRLGICIYSRGKWCCCLFIVRARNWDSWQLLSADYYIEIGQRVHISRPKEKKNTQTYGNADDVWWFLHSRKNFLEPFYHLKLIRYLWWHVFSATLWERMVENIAN